MFVQSRPGKVIKFRPVQTYLYVEVRSQIHAPAPLSPLYLVDRRLGGSQSRYGHVGEE
jgi:hypothetical protein